MAAARGAAYRRRIEAHSARGGATREGPLMTTARLAACTLLLIAVFLAGCAARPVAEVRLVSRAFDDLNAASQPLLDDLALAERDQGRQAAEVRAKARAQAGGKPSPAAGADRRPGAAAADPCPDVLLVGGEKPGWPAIQDGFCLRDSPYFSAIGDPPATRTFRRGLAAVGDYTQLLLLLAEDRNLDEAKAQLQALAGNLGVALEAAGVGGASVVASPVLEALNPLIELAAKDANAAELKRVVLQESPKVEALVAALSKAAPELFRTVSQTSFRRFNTVGLGNIEVAKVEAQRIEAYRAAVSNYVLLLDEYRELLRALAAAYDRPRQTATLAHLAERSAQLSARSDAWRRSLASLRTALP
jgi:hypothetical protein